MSLIWLAFVVCLTITQPHWSSTLPTNSLNTGAKSKSHRGNDVAKNAPRESLDAHNLTVNQENPESLNPTTHDVWVQMPRPAHVMRSKRDVWDDCFPASTRDPFQSILYLGDVITGILGNLGGVIPPITSMIRLGKSLFETNKCNGQSLWLYIDSHIQRSIKAAFNNKFRLTSEKLASDRQTQMKDFNRRLEWLEAGDRTSVEIKDVIDDMHDHLKTTDMTDRYNFVHYANIYNMDYGLATWYYADLVYKKTLLLTIMGVCEKLNEPDADPKYLTSFYARKLEELTSKAIRVAVKDGPATMKNLFWKDYSCDQTNWIYTTTYTLVYWFNEICRFNKHGWHYLKCTDFFGNEWKQHWKPGYNHNGNCDHTRSRYFNAASESADPKIIQKPVAEWMAQNFTLPILKLFGCNQIPSYSENDVKTDLPNAYFPSNCHSPCNHFGERYRWCIKGTSGGPGGSWGKCEFPASPGETPWRSDLRCGSSYQVNGKPGQCNPSGTYPCCSDRNWCGNTSKHCKCSSCIDYRVALESSPTTSESKWKSEINSILQCARNGRET